MQTRIKHRFEVLIRAVHLASRHPVAVPRATQLTTTLADLIDDIYRYLGQQDSGWAEYRSGAAVRAKRAEELLALMRPVNKIARTINQEEFPGLRQKFRMPRGDGYERLIGSAAAFVESANAHRTVFTDRGLDEDFTEQITAKRAELLAATSLKYAGRRQQVGATAGVAAFARRGMQLLRELDAILTHRYRNDPGLLAAWRSAVRVQQDPERAEDEAETPAQDAVPIEPSAPSAATVVALESPFTRAIEFD